MKIDELNQKTAVTYLAAGRTDKSGPAEVYGEAVAKQSAGADKVDLSSYLPVASVSKSQSDLRTSRVAEVKAQIASGSYQVSGRAVAEKMLSTLAMGSSSGARG